MKDVKFFVAWIFHSTQNALLLKLDEIKLCLYLFKIIRNTLKKKKKKEKHSKRVKKEKKKKSKKQKREEKSESADRSSVSKHCSGALHLCRAVGWKENGAIENVYKTSMWSSWQCRLLVLENGISLLIFVWRCNSNELCRETERCTPILKYHMGRRENYLYKSGWKLEVKAAKNCVRKIREQSFKTLESIFLWYFCFLHRK